MPTQNSSAQGKKITEWLRIKVSRITLWWAGLKVQNGSKNLVIVHGRVRDDAEKKMWMKKNDKWRITTTKWRSTSQKPSEVRKYHRWEFLTFDLKKQLQKVFVNFSSNIVEVIRTVFNFFFLMIRFHKH